MEELYLIGGKSDVKRVTEKEDHTTSVGPGTVEDATICEIDCQEMRCGRMLPRLTQEVATEQSQDVPADSSKHLPLL